MKATLHTYLFREHHKEYKDDESLQADEDGIDVGHKEEVSVEDQDANDPRDAHDNHQRDGGLQPVPGGGADTIVACGDSYQLTIC